MRIHLIYGYYLPSVGGIQIDVNNLAREFTNKGHEVTIHTSTLLPGKARAENQEKERAGTVKRYRAVGFPGFRRLIVDPGIIPGIATAKGDIFHVLSFVPNLHTIASLFIGSLKKTPLLYTPVFRPGRDQTYSGILGFLLKNIWDKRLGLWLRNRADIVIAQTRFEEESYKMEGLNNVVQIGVGIDSSLKAITEAEIQRFTNRFGVGSKVLLVVGRIEPRKGHKFLLEAWGRVIERHPDAKLLIAGDDLNRHPEVEGSLSESVRHSVVSLGVLSQKDLRIAYASVAATVIPSVYEVTSRVVLEAWAEACPVIVTEGVGLSEDVKEDIGWVVPYGNSQSLSSAISDVFSFLPAARNKGALSQKYVREHFSWEKIANQTLELYGKAIEKTT